MVPQPDSTDRASVAPFLLDGSLVLPALNRIRLGEQIVQVEPRVMMVLVSLAQRPGEVLSREYLFETVWPRVVVCEEALTRTISELRRIFGDDSKAPRVIETIRKSGYRLLAPVTPASESDLRPLTSPPGAGGAPAPIESAQPTLPTATEPFSIADWLVEPKLSRLSRNGRLVRLEPRVMQVLTGLATSPGAVVSRSSLLRAVWPQTDVQETTLTSAISDLRRVFDDDADAPSYIETIRGVGYRLVAPVRPLAAPGAGNEGASDWRSPHAARRKAWLLGASALAALVVALLLVRGAQAPAPPAREWRIRPLTAYPGPEYTPALSPDGSKLVFSWQGENPDGSSLLDLYVMQLENGPPTRLTADAGNEVYAAWSPDGSTIAYACGMGDSFAICTVPLLGGRRVKLMQAGSRVAGLDWSADGTRIAYSVRPDSGNSFRIHLLDLQSMKSAPLDVPRRHGDEVLPAFSPDGKSLAFVREENLNQQRVLLTVIGSGVVEELSGARQRVSGLDWASDHELLLSVSNLVDYDLWLADLNTGRRTWLTIPGRPAISPTSARGGSRIVYGELAYECNIWSIDVTQAREIRQDAEPIIASTRTDYNPICSPDNASIAFLSDRSGRIELWIAEADGSNPWQLTEEAGTYLMNPCWSPDSRRLAYSAMSGEYLRVVVSDVETKGASTLSTADRHELLQHWSRSGEWLYYRVQRADAWELWRRRVDGGGEERVSETGYTVVGEAPHGNLLCWRDDEPGIWTLPAAGGDARELIGGDATRNWTGAALAEGGVFFIRQGIGAARLGFYDWTDAREDSLGLLPQESGFLVLSPDGTRLLYDCTTRVEIDLTLAELAPKT